MYKLTIGVVASALFASSAFAQQTSGDDVFIGGDASVTGTVIDGAVISTAIGDETEANARVGAIIGANIGGAANVSGSVETGGLLAVATGDNSVANAAVGVVDGGVDISGALDVLSLIHI